MFKKKKKRICRHITGKEHHILEKNEPEWPISKHSKKCLELPGKRTKTLKKERKFDGYQISWQQHFISGDNGMTYLRYSRKKNMSHILLIQLNLPSSIKTADKLLSIIRNSGNIVPRSLSWVNYQRMKLSGETLT